EQNSQIMVMSIISSELLNLLNAALALELKVSVLYMLQHAIWSGKTASSKNNNYICKFVVIEKKNKI
ncbi:MAG: hypothetical protein ACFFD7_03980, partial [Candidatus Thorarchaeota archaeon]